MDEITYLCCGKLIKTFGVKGELIAVIEEDSLIEKIYDEPVFILIGYEQVPFFVEDCRHQHGDLYILKIEDVDKPEKAAKLVSCSLFTVQKTASISDVSLSFMNVAGYKVYDGHYGLIGTIDKVLKFPSHNVLQIFSSGKEVLIPYHKQIIKSIDHTSAKIELNVPDGIIDFYMNA